MLTTVVMIKVVREEVSYRHAPIMHKFSMLLNNICFPKQRNLPDYRSYRSITYYPSPHLPVLLTILPASGERGIHSGGFSLRVSHEVLQLLFRTVPRYYLHNQVTYLLCETSYITNSIRYSGSDITYTTK